MKKEIRNILCFLVGVAVCFVLLDIGVGQLFDRLIRKMPPDGERVAKSYHCLHKVQSDVVIVGSSRAETGYDCSILSDSMPQFSFYNCGGDAQEFYYVNTLINSMLDRYVPKAIVWDFKERQFEDGEKENLGLIYPYYWKNPYIREVLDRLEGPSFKWRVRLSSYRYNATAGRILRAILSPDSTSQNSMGFGGRPITDVSKTIVPNDFQIDDCEPDQRKIDCFIATAQRAQAMGCRLFVVISPMYDDYNQDNVYTRAVCKACGESGAVFIDDSHLEGFLHNNAIAYDNYHLNIVGAQRFSQLLASQLKPYLGVE